MSVEQRGGWSIGWAWGGLAALLALAAGAVMVWHGAGGEGAESAGLSADDTLPGATVSSDPRAGGAGALAGQPGEAPGRTAKQVSATELFRQYRESGGRAGEQYRQQRLSLSGTLLSMEEGAEGVLVLSLQAGPDLEAIRAVMSPSQRAGALGVSPGTPVVLDCMHQGVVMGEPVLADCRLPL